MRRRIIRLLAPTAVLLGLGAFPALAGAHAQLISSTPSMESTVGSAPRAIVLRFDEAYNLSLSDAHLYDSSTGLEIAATETKPNPREIVLAPDGTLPQEPYLVTWHTASADDGHVLDGSFGFGVGVAPVDPNRLVGRFSGIGWLRITARTLMFISLFFFAGGLLVPVLLGTRGPLSAWLLPAAAYRDGAGGGAAVARLDLRTIRAGWCAVAAAATTALTETADAGGSLSAGTLKAYLLTNMAGVSRLAGIVLILGAVCLVSRRRRVAAGLVALSFLGLALGGHANSASLRVPTILVDWIHLVAASVWAGGIAQIAVTWSLGADSRLVGGRMAAVRQVLPRFGVIALPAFLVLAVAGALDALFQLGSPSALLDTSYGRVLLVKVVLVATMAGLSYLHAMRLRPLLLARKVRDDYVRLERRHWRLLSGEAMLSWAALLVVAVLVAFPLPPSQLAHGHAAAPAAPAQVAQLPSAP